MARIRGLGNHARLQFAPNWLLLLALTPTVSVIVKSMLCLRNQVGIPEPLLLHALNHKGQALHGPEFSHVLPSGKLADAAVQVLAAPVVVHAL